MSLPPQALPSSLKNKKIGTQMNADFQDVIKSNPPYSKGEKGLMIHRSRELPLLSLEKGGREGFLEKPFQAT